MIMILFLNRKHFLIRLVQMTMKELKLKVTMFYEQTIQVTKKEEAFVCIIRNTLVLLQDMIYIS